MSKKNNRDVECNQISAETHRGSESILLVEDDESVRRISTQILRECGYNVLPAGNGEEASALCECPTENLQLLITDVVLPGMTATCLESQVRRQNPGIHVLYVSGYLQDALLERGIAEHEGNFLSKPYSPIALANKVREVLDKARN